MNENEQRQFRSRIALKYGQGRGILLSQGETAELYRLLQECDDLLAEKVPQTASDISVAERESNG